MSSNNKTFFDSNTIVALVVTFAFFFGWQQYLKIKYPETVKVEKKTEKAQTSSNSKNSKAVKDIEGDSSASLLLPKVLNVDSKTQVFSFQDEYLNFDISSKGMSLKNIQINKINKVANIPYKYDYIDGLFPTQINGESLIFEIVKVDDHTYIGTAPLSGDRYVEKTVNINSKMFILDIKLKFINFNMKNKFILGHPLVARIKDPKKAIFFLPAFDRNEFFYENLNGDDRRILQTDEKTEETEEIVSTNLVALSDHYFSLAFLNTSTVLPDTFFTQNNENISIDVKYSFGSQVKFDEVDYSIFVGPKRLDLLESSEGGLIKLIDFTFLGFIAIPILKALNYIFGIVGNYGLAVIVLTFLIRLLILPLAVSSFKSMKKMQVIQPKLKEVKEKYKGQPEKVNQMTMQIMKDNKVNPIGGCLPMLLQMPIFFAFYRALSESVDLYQAPFILWITDLSKIDPYFVLPVFSVVGMVVHQIVTPNTMDKAQKRLMMFMPIIFGFFIFTLPSALTLYMVVTTWFGIAQHAIFLRDKKPTQAT